MSKMKVVNEIELQGFTRELALFLYYQMQTYAGLEAILEPVSVRIKGPNRDLTGRELVFADDAGATIAVFMLDTATWEYPET